MTWNYKTQAFAAAPPAWYKIKNKENILLFFAKSVQRFQHERVTNKKRVTILCLKKKRDFMFTHPSCSCSSRTIQTAAWRATNAASKPLQMRYNVTEYTSAPSADLCRPGVSAMHLINHEIRVSVIVRRAWQIATYRVRLTIDGP